jgi:thiamine-phosphate pyrophosphorylase
MAPAERLELLGRLAALGRDFGATVAVHDDIAAACACGTGLHLPAHGDAAMARRSLGPDALIGQSCHSRAELAAALHGGADYATMSPVFASTSKPGYAPAEDIANSIAGLRLAILALGGIDAPPIGRLPAGFAGVAVMGAAMRAAEPEAWFAGILAAWRGRNAGSGHEAGFS